MKNYWFFALAFMGGALLAAQNGLNAQLGTLLKHPLYATFVSFFTSAILAFFVIAIVLKQPPSIQDIKEVPHYLWYVGGCFSVAGLYLYYHTTPKLGIATMITLGLCGQLLFSTIAGHYGWFGLPEKPINYKSVIGIVLLIAGTVLVTQKD